MNECCQDADNRIVVDVKEETDNQGKTIMKIEMCSVCNRKHYTLYAEPLVMEMEDNG